MIENTPHNRNHYLLKHSLFCITKRCNVCLSFWHTFMNSVTYIYTFNLFGTPDQYFLAKLKYLKGTLQNWRYDVSKLEHGDLKQLREKVDRFELEAESRILSDSKIIDRRESLFKIGELEYPVKFDMRQKAKVNGYVMVTKTPGSFMEC